jgi:hypothetical protein
VRPSREIAGNFGEDHAETETVGSKLANALLVKKW